jgi:hypothetical protein
MPSAPEGYSAGWRIPYFLKVREERKRTSRILFGYLSGQGSSAADYDTNEYLAESAIPVTKLHTMAE